jgi:hypothetical protein
MDDHIVRRTLYRTTHAGLLGKFALVALAALPEETGTAGLLARLAETTADETSAALDALAGSGLVDRFEYEGETRYRLVPDDDEMTFDRLKDRLWATMEENPGTPHPEFVALARQAAVKYAGLKGLGTGVTLENMVISHALGTCFPQRFASSEGAWKSHSRWWTLRKAHGTEAVLTAIQYVATYGDPDKGDPIRLATWALNDVAANPRALTASRFTQMRSAA